LGNRWGSHHQGRPQSGSGIESAVESQGDSLSKSKGHSWNELRAESATESMSESEIQILNDLWNESSSHFGVQSGIQAASHLQNDSASDGRSDSWNDLPSADGGDGSVLVLGSDQHAASGSEPGAV